MKLRHPITDGQYVHGAAFIGIGAVAGGWRGALLGLGFVAFCVVLSQF